MWPFHRHGQHAGHGRFPWLWHGRQPRRLERFRPPSLHHRHAWVGKPILSERWQRCQRILRRGRSGCSHRGRRGRSRRAGRRPNASSHCGGEGSPPSVRILGFKPNTEPFRQLAGPRGGAQQATKCSSGRKRGNAESTGGEPDGGLGGQGRSPKLHWWQIPEAT